MPNPAPACRRGLTDATARWPTRKRDSDGILGDARHQARKSDHNQGNAFDVTHDPASGCDGNLIAAAAIKDARVTYVIWNRQIWNRSQGDTAWRPYSGSNPHTKHCHVSIKESARGDLRPWAWAPAGSLPEAPPARPPEPPTGASQAEMPPPPAGGADAPRPTDVRAYPGTPLRKGMRGELVRLLQQRLRALRWDIAVDGGFGDETDRVIRAFQRRRGLEADGIVGRRTWNTLFT
jgi:hypothetical protein